MKTIKEYLDELDIEELSEYFFVDRYLECVKNEKSFQNKTLSEIREISDRYLNRLLKRLKKLEPQKISHKKTGVFFGSEAMDGCAVMQLVYIEDLIKDRVDAKLYGYDFAKHEEILSYYLAETQYTKNHINELFADFFWEITWYGIKQEKLDKMLNNLKKAMKESDEEIEKYKKLKKPNKVTDIYKVNYPLVEDSDFIYDLESQLYKHTIKKQISEVMLLLQKDNL